MLQSHLCIRQRSHVAALHVARRTISFNFFSKKDLEKREEIIKNQDDFETDRASQIIMLGKHNSTLPAYQKQKVSVPKIARWKNRTVKLSEIEETFSRADVDEAIANAYNEVYEASIGDASNSNADLHDLAKRFKVVKAVQANLGFDLNDATVSQCHTVSSLFREVAAVVEKRYVFERNPNGIDVRPHDFTAPNIYLNLERKAPAQKQMLKSLVESAENNA